MLILFLNKISMTGYTNKSECLYSPTNTYCKTHLQQMKYYFLYIKLFNNIFLCLVHFMTSYHFRCCLYCKNVLFG